MIPIDRFERQLPMALTHLAQPQTPDYLTDILGRTAGTRQRPAWASIERWLPVELVTSRVPMTRLPWRQIGVVALLAVLLAGLLAAYVGSRQNHLPAPFGPAANGLVVYSKGGDIFVRDALDGASRPLVSTSDHEIADSVSPLGTHVLVVVPDATDALQLDVVGIDGRDRVHIGGPYRNVTGMSWSPDESEIAVSNEVGGIQTMTIVRTDGSGERNLALGMPADTPQFRPPDGRQLAFRGEIDGNWGLFLVNRDGSGLKPVDVHRDLMEAPYEVLGPAWSPDGRRIAFHRLVLTPGNGNGNGFRIDVAALDSIGNVTAEPTYEFNRLSDDELAVQWLPDGQDIVFQRFDGSTDYLSVVRPEPGAVARDLDLTTNGDIDTMRTTVSPDGRFLVTHLLTDNTDWVVDLASGTATHADIDGEDFVHIQRRAP
jgi:Tol biopolymer transport system component